MMMMMKGKISRPRGNILDGMNRWLDRKPNELAQEIETIGEL
jgi:hypothetical protein